MICSDNIPNHVSKDGVKKIYFDIDNIPDVDKLYINSVPKLNFDKKYILPYKDNFIDAKYKSYINNFYKVIKGHVSNVNLKFFKNNISCLKIQERTDFCDLVKGPNTGTILGLYNYKLNTIFLLKNEAKKSINHELLHLSSTFSKDDLFFTGFYQNVKENGIIFGKYFNEGYTSLLDKQLFSDSSCDNSYMFEREIVSIIQTVLGKDNMNRLYFKADLYHLIEQIAEYMSYGDIIDFLVYFDALSKYLETNESYDNSVINYSYGNLRKFLVDLIDKRFKNSTYFMSKLNYDYCNAIINFTDSIIECCSNNKVLKK